MSHKTYLTPTRQLDKSMSYALESSSPYDAEDFKVAMAVKNTKWLRVGDFVFFQFNNGQAERWVAWGMSSKGRRLKYAYLHFQKQYPDVRKRSRRGRNLWPVQVHGPTFDADVVIVNDGSGQPITLKQVIERWSADPTVQQDTVESLRAGTVVRR